MDANKKLIKDHAEAFFIYSSEIIDDIDLLGAQDLDFEYAKQNQLEFSSPTGAKYGLLVLHLVECNYLNIINDGVCLPFVKITKEGRDFLAR